MGAIQPCQMPVKKPAVFSVVFIPLPGKHPENRKKINITIKIISNILVFTEFSLLLLLVSFIPQRHKVRKERKHLFSHEAREDHEDKKY
jgi:hypothetical protein